MRTPFPPHQISKLPKATKAQNEAVKADYKKGIRCTICGGWHHPEVVHLDYVGHAALTDRMLDVDPDWSWEPFAVGPDGLPLFDRNGGLWIRLTILGKTRPGYGDAEGKVGGNAVKEAIGDALRNAAMRFGAALDLWHKGDLHIDEGEEAPLPADMPDAEWARLVQLIEASKADRKAMLDHFKVPDLRRLNQDQYAEALELLNAKLAKAAKAETNAIADDLGDEIPY
jgi:hypothetical protein